MTTFALNTIMDAIANTLLTQAVAPAGKVYAYPVPNFDSPCIIVGYPKAGNINLDLTFKRGGIEATFPVWYVVSKVMDKAARDLLSGILDGGATTVKTALESGGGTLGGVVASTFVLSPLVESMQDSNIPPTEYLAVRLDVQVLA